MSGSVVHFTHLQISQISITSSTAKPEMVYDVLTPHTNFIHPFQFTSLGTQTRSNPFMVL